MLLTQLTKLAQLTRVNPIENDAEDSSSLLQRVRQIANIGPVFLPDVGQVYSDSAATTLATTDGVVGSWTEIGASNGANQYNILTQTNNFGNAAWTKVGGSFSGSTFTSSASLAYFTQIHNEKEAVTYRMTAYVSAGTTSVVYLFNREDIYAGSAFFDLSDLSVQTRAGSQTTPSNLSVTAIGGGVYAISADFAHISGTQYFGIGIADAKGVFAVTSGKTAYFYSIDARPTSTVGLLPDMQYVGASWSSKLSAIQATTANKPYLRVSGTKRWIESSVATPALAVTLGSTISNATVFEAGYDRVYKDTGQTIASGYNIAPPAPYIGGIIIVGRATTPAEDAIITRLLSAYTKVTAISKTTPSTRAAFSMTVRTTGTNETFQWPNRTPAANDYRNAVIDWGDGSTTTSTGDLTAHTYTTAGDYVITVTGSYTAPYFNNVGDKTKLRSINHWGAVRGMCHWHNAFYGATNLASTLPTDASSDNTLKATGPNGVSSLIRSCTNITSIPARLFAYNLDLSANAFLGTFQSCTGITSIPADLFRYNTAISTSGFYGTFQSCTGITSIPADLFRYNIACTSFYRTFYGCTNLQLRSDVFFPAGGEATRFLNQTVTFDNCFFRTGTFTGTQGTAPALWSCNFGSGTPTKTDCFQGHTTSTVSNHADIPAEWL